MLKDSQRRETRSTLVNVDRDLVLEELDHILSSSHFCNSKRYPALLCYVVESTLAGKSDSLKERTLGVEIFGRPADYDTNSDTIVRYTAGEVRKRLLLYYSEEGRDSEIRISLAPGSYVPEFQYASQKQPAEPAPVTATNSNGQDTASTQEKSTFSESSPLFPALPSDHDADKPATALTPPAASRSWIRPLVLSLVAVTLVVAALGVWNWRHRMVPPQSALAEFWTPIITGQQQVLICTGAVVFNQGTYSGTRTANRDVEYPFISLQNAAAIAHVSSQLEHYGITAPLKSSSSTPLTELREHSIVLIGAYNNQWTMRLLAPLRFHFSPHPSQSVVDTNRPQYHLERDISQPYSSADDYALVARYRDPVTDGWVVVAAGIGRNGTEAAADFVTSAHYMQLLRNRIGSSIANRNIEAVLRVNVIDGKTGAPSIVDVYSW